MFMVWSHSGSSNQMLLVNINLLRLFWPFSSDVYGPLFFCHEQNFIFKHDFIIPIVHGVHFLKPIQEVENCIGY